MPRLIDDLYALGDNTALFDSLRKGGDLSKLDQALADTPAVPKGRKTELLASTREALVPALSKNDPSALHKLIGDNGTCERVSIFGELVLALHALAEGGHAGAAVDAVRETALHLALDIAGALEADPPQDADDAELLLHGIAMREWAHLLAGYYRAGGMQPYEAESLMLRARATNTTLSSWPHLVGAAMVDVARALEPLGKVEVATRCYDGVRLDLRYLITRPVNPSYEFETTSALFWLQRACEERIRLLPGDKDAQADLQAVRRLRQEHGYPDAVSEPRFGPIARTYLDRIPYLALIIRDITAAYDEERARESIAAICGRYGCLSTDVDFYVSAIGSYHLRRTVLLGVNTLYDEAHQEVFDAIDYLRDPDESEGQDRENEPS